MKISYLVQKEIKRRKLNFALCLLSVIVAVVSVCSVFTMLEIYDLRTKEIVQKKEQETKVRMDSLEDDYRKITKQLGFNLLILPKNQNISDVYANDFASKFMPEKYVEILANSKSMLIRHLLPSLQQKIVWPEKQRTIVLAGTRGEVPFAHKAPKEPMMVAVPKGTMIIGYELHQSLGVKVGDKLRIMNREFTVQKCNESRGNIDDITIWIDLKESQELLNKPGKINAILALSCHCSGGNLSKIRDEVHSVLPETQVYEKGSRVLIRAEARDRAAKEAKEAILAEIKQRKDLRKERENLAAIIVPLVLLTSVVWIVFLFMGNVRERKSEIGILRAVGVNEVSIMKLFLLKAFWIGIIGAFCGYVLGIGGGSILGGLFSVSLVNVPLFVAVIILAPLLSIIAAWVPAVIASRQDPAEVLKEE